MFDLIVMHVADNDFDESACCSFASSCINLRSLQTIHLDLTLDLTPARCIQSGHWQRAGLVKPPDEVVRRGWMPVIKYLQAGPLVAVHELRLMLIGDGEVGKTSLYKSFTAEGHRAGRIPKEERTVGIDLSDYLFPASPDIGPEIHVQVCDFAGQEIYHLSHTLQFTRRCLYMLMWTTHKYSDSNAAQALDIEDIMGPLKRWLQLLAANVPEACVVVVGTHCRVDPDSFASMQVLVDKHVKEEIERLRFIAQQEAEATRRVLKLQEEEVAKLCLEIKAESSAFQTLHVPDHRSLSLQVCEQFMIDMAALINPLPNSSLRRKAQSLLDAMQELTRTKVRLGRLHGVHDGSHPAASAAVAHLKLISDRSFAVDSVEGVGVAELLRAIEATCRDRNALPFMGEEVPVSWLQVKEALKLEAVRKVVGDCVMSVDDAAAKVQSSLRLQQLEVNFDKARALRDADVQRCLEFWALLGRVFVYQGHFVRDVSLVIELMKPLVHHSVSDRKFIEEFCTGSFDGMSHCLHQLQHAAILDLRLLSCFNAWASASPKAQRSLLKFFKESFMVSDLARGSALGASSCLITARLCDSTDADRQHRAAAEAAAIEAESEFLAVYSIPSAHIGLIARMQAIINDAQPIGVHLLVTCSHSHVCISLESGSRMRCCVSLRSLEDVFRSPKLANLKYKVPDDTFSHAFVICSTDDGLFSFATRCADAIMHSGAFSAHFQCWLPVFPYSSRALVRADWVPKCEDWTSVGSGTNKMRLSQIVCANSDSPVLSVPLRKLREIFPRRPPIFMSHTYIRGSNKTSGDGTGEFCQRVKDRLQERLMCTVWFDRDEMGGLAAFTDLMKEGVAHASAFVVCLSPLYLTRPNCLRELMWAMDICEKDHSKLLRIIPTHPSVSFAGCKSIIDLAAAGCGAHVILPANDTDPKSPPLLLEQLKGHRLSDVAISLLKRLVGSKNQGTNAEWLKLQPWLSDIEGENWEEASKAWYGPRECESVEMESCFGALALDLQAAVLGDRHASPVDWLVDIEDDQLCSAPRSQEYTEAPDVALLRTCFPQTLKVFPDEKDAVELMMLGLRDAHVINCVEHGLSKTSAVTSQANPLDPVFRMAAHMSGVNFNAAAQSLKNIRKKYALPLLFLELDQLLLIISCPKNESFDALDSSSVVTDKDVLDCIAAGKPCGALQHINCPLDLNAVFAKAKQKFSDKKKEELNSIIAAYFAESSEVNAPADVQTSRLHFFQWLMQERETHVVCRVEGTDDVLLVDALMDWSEHVTRIVTRSPPVAWNDFSYKAKTGASRVEMQIRLANIPDVESHLRTGVFAFLLDGSVHKWNDNISSLFPGADYQWTDVTDGDLKLPISVLSSGAKPSSSVRSRCWKSRGIENMLLHPTCVLWLARKDVHVASNGFRNIFKTMSNNFFGSAGLNSHAIVSCAKMAGPGWMGWHEIPFEESKLPQHGSMTQFLKRVVDAVLVSGSSVASAMLVFFEFFREVCPVSEVEKEQKNAVKVLLPKYANVFNLMSKDCSDVALFQQQLQQFSGADSSLTEDRCKALWCMGHALIDTQQAIMILGQGTGQSLVPKDARAAFWQRNKPLAALATAGPACFIYAFPRFLCFLNCLCCANGIDAAIKAAARSCVSAVFRVLCAIPFGMEDDADVRHEGLNSMLFRSNTATPCSGYVPRPGGEMCLQCEQPDDCHVLKHDCQRCDTDNETQFMRVACRVGSMGWDSHPLMQLVHGVRHLGSNVAESGVVSGFLESTVALSQLSYRQHLHQHIFGANPARRDFVPCDLCASKSLALDSLPQIVRDEVERLQRERREEFQGFIGAIDGHFAPKSPPANTDGSVPAESIARPQTQVQQQQGTESVPSSASTLPAPLPSSPAPASDAPLDPLASQLSSISLSNSVEMLAQLSSRLQACGVTSLSDLEGMSIDDVRATVAGANLNPLQFKKLFDAVSKPKP